MTKKYCGKCWREIVWDKCPYHEGKHIRSYTNILVKSKNICPCWNEFIMYPRLKYCCKTCYIKYKNSDLKEKPPTD